jgi:tetratricopeptide (TPR) repeat protein
VKTFLRLFLLLAAGSGLLPAQTPDDALRENVELIIKEFERKNYDEVIKRIDDLRIEGDGSAFVLNLKGAAYTRLKDYSKAEESFKAALDESPGMFAATFNLGEILFLQKQYDKARDWFRGMLINDPRNELLQFKVFLAHLQLGDNEAAQKMLNAMKFPGDSPAWYYANAAWEFSKGNKRRASDYLAGARFIFPDKTEIFDETFTDLGLPTR